MFKRAKNIFSVLWSMIRFALIKALRWKEFEFSLIERFSPGTMMNIHKGSKLCLGNRVRAHSNVRISVTNGATMKIGNDVRINYNCIFVCQDAITIGDGVEFGPNVVVYDHDHDFGCAEGIKANRFKKKPIIIGENSWIGAGAIILKGVTIGANCVIGAGSVVTGDIPDDTVFYQKREGHIREIVRNR